MRIVIVFIPIAQGPTPLYTFGDATGHSKNLRTMARPVSPHPNLFSHISGIHYIDHSTYPIGGTNQSAGPVPGLIQSILSPDSPQRIIGLSSVIAYVAVVTGLI